jgi:hypothetical protein
MLYNRLKTPFYNVYVRDSEASEFLKLPNSVSSLIEKVEILETFTNETCMHGVISLTLTEGSREPYSTDGHINTSELYGKDALVSNKTGMLCDLKYEATRGGTGITRLSSDAVGAVANTATNLTGTSANAADIIEEVYGNTKGATGVKYLFEANNRIKVEWGYLEDKTLTREVVGYIITVQAEFPENDQPKVIIHCGPSSYALDQISIGIGQTYVKKINSAIDSVLGQLEDFEGTSVPDILKDICAKAGMDYVISDKFLNQDPPKGTGKVNSGDLTFNKFLNRLAKNHDAYYRVIVDPKTQKDTILFLTKKDIDKTLILEDTNLLRYRANGSILKAISINVDYAKSIGNQNIQINKQGKTVVVNSSDSTQIAIVDGEESAINDPTSNNAVPAAKGAQANISKSAKKKATTHTEVHAARMDPQSIREDSQAKAGCQIKDYIALEFQTIGYPKLIPGTYIFSGIGERYSGTYHVINVTHVLDKDGYSCRGNAQSNSIKGYSGVKFVSPTVIPKNDKVQKKLLNRVSNPADVGVSTAEASPGDDDAGKKYKLVASNDTDNPEILDPVQPVDMG